MRRAAPFVPRNRRSVPAAKPAGARARIGRTWAASLPRTPDAMRRFLADLRFSARSLRIEYGSETGLAAYWGLWFNSGAWGGHRHFAIEATTGRFDQIDRAMRDGSAGQIGPMGRADWSTRWSLLPSS